MPILRTIKHLLTFRLTRLEMLHFNRKHFIAGLLGTWVAGIGRYWDSDDASLLQHLGLGSVIYIFVLSAFIWLIVKPYFVDDWNYFTVLTFISLTSFPAIFYAIPVERFFTLKTANEMNVWFLIVVASWRLSLLYYFLNCFTRLGFGQIVTITLLPICLIITTLTMLNLHKVVFDLMGGLSKETPHDGAYGVLIFLTVISAILIVPLIISYGNGIYNRQKERKNKLSN